jgi:hypothetical protein
MRRKVEASAPPPDAAKLSAEENGGKVPLAKACESVKGAHDLFT